MITKSVVKRRIYSQLLLKLITVLVGMTLFFYIGDSTDLIENIKSYWIIVVLMMFLYSALAVDQLIRADFFEKGL